MRRQFWLWQTEFTLCSRPLKCWEHCSPGVMLAWLPLRASVCRKRNLHLLQVPDTRRICSETVRQPTVRIDILIRVKPCTTRAPRCTKSTTASEISRAKSPITRCGDVLQIRPVLLCSQPSLYRSSRLYSTPWCTKIRLSGGMLLTSSTGPLMRNEKSGWVSCCFTTMKHD